ncbi:MAG TPA: hypothetical protein VGG56_06790 [Terracidiphilus sp.]|jgi:hypothetical protein
MAFLSATCLICERVLRETDNAVSVIRLVNIFSFKSIPDLPVDKQAVPIVVFGIVQFSANDDDKHTVVLVIVRPDGEQSEVPLTTDQQIPVGPIIELPRAAHIIAQLGVVPRQVGIHQVVLKVDGIERARTQFVLRQAPDDPTLELSGSPPQVLG